MVRLVFPTLVLTGSAIAALCGSPINGCPRLTPRAPPQDVKDLKPVDIRVVGALGDSFTAAFAALNFPYEDRAEAWATGNKTDATTLRNFFEYYGNPVASHSVAVSGDIVQGMVKQAERLVASLKSDTSLDFDNDWKLVTILIGGNNQCQSCFGDPQNYDPKVYDEDLTAAIDILQRGLPRTVVSLISMMNLDSLATASGVADHCHVPHIIGKLECPCPFVGPESAAMVRKTIEADNAVLFEVAKRFQRNDFSVVVQPGSDMVEVKDWTWLSRFDCFHPALKTHQEVAKAVWRNLFEPVEKKTRKFQLPIEMYCPSDDDVIHTRANTGKTVVV